MVLKTVYFEKKYGVNIANVKSTSDVDNIIEKSIGRELGVVKIDHPVINHSGCVFPLRDYRVDKSLDEKLSHY